MNGQVQGKNEGQATGKGFRSSHPAFRAKELEGELQYAKEQIEFWKKKYDNFYVILGKIRSIRSDNPMTDQELKGYGNYEKRLLEIVWHLSCYEEVIL